MSALKFPRPPAALGWRFGLVVLLLAIFSLALGTQNAVEVNENTRCLAVYIQRDAEVSRIRAAATAEKDAAVNNLLDRVTRVILNPRSAEAAQSKIRTAAEKYRREAIELDAKRSANPLPGFPQRCNDLNR